MSSTFKSSESEMMKRLHLTRPAGLQLPSELRNLTVSYVIIQPAALKSLRNSRRAKNLVLHASSATTFTSFLHPPARYELQRHRTNEEEKSGRRRYRTLKWSPLREDARMLLVWVPQCDRTSCARCRDLVEDTAASHFLSLSFFHRLATHSLGPLPHTQH